MTPAVRYRLVPHPDRPAGSVRSIHVDIVVSAGGVRLRYTVDGATQMVCPDAAEPKRTDELWKTTCFELFAQPEGEDAYVEFNFSPSRQWAAYAFDGHRAGMRDLPLDAPHVGSIAEADRFVLDVNLGAVALDLSAARLGATAIVEERDGTRSFWALGHAPGAPDFHNRDCFTARLSAPDAS